MKIYCDVETEGLNSQKFVMGCIKTETSKKFHIYTSKQKMWKNILDIAKKQHKRGRITTVYAHNHEYDFYAYADITDPNLRFNSLNPFIASYLIEGKESIKFLDTLAILPMSLKKAGEALELPKLETPIELTEEEYHPIYNSKIEPYIKRDVEIVEAIITTITNILKKLGSLPRRLYTISHIAAHLFFQHTLQYEELLDRSEELPRYHLSEHPKTIHKAYKGGRIECFQYGTHQNTTSIDCNSLYPTIAQNMRYPDNRTEKRVDQPLRKYSMKALLDHIGIHKAMIGNTSDKIGSLLIKQEKSNTTLQEGNYAIGYFTSEELKDAIINGHTLYDIEYSILYEETNNPYNTYINTLYNKRKEATTKIEDILYKFLMNCSFGKLAQRKNNREFFYDSVEKIEEYLEQGYTVLRGDGFQYLYNKNIPLKEPKRFYNPIIPTLINAQARIHMNQHFRKFEKEQLLYTDTDSIIFKGQMPDVPINNNLGSFKIQHENQSITIFGQKQYILGDELTSSGTGHSTITDGVIHYKRKNSILTSTPLLVGTFNDHTTLLQEKEIEEQPRILIEPNTTIHYFQPQLEIINEILIN